MSGADWWRVGYAAEFATNVGQIARSLERIATRLDARDENERLREALERVRAVQPATLEKLRSNGVVFAGPLGADPKNWEHVAFSIYTDLCEVETIARTALGGTNGTSCAWPGAGDD